MGCAGRLQSAWLAVQRVPFVSLTRYVLRLLSGRGADSVGLVQSDTEISSSAYICAVPARNQHNVASTYDTTSRRCSHGITDVARHYLSGVAVHIMMAHLTAARISHVAASGSRLRLTLPRLAASAPRCPCPSSWAAPCP